MSTELRLTAADVERLMNDPSTAVRQETAAKVASAFRGATLSESERTLAEQIFRVMLRDAEVNVRRALSENLKDNPGVPHDVARALAGDVAEVATPMLEFSSVLTEADLVEIIQSRPLEHQVAVARRDALPEAVSQVLIEQAGAPAVTALMQNPAAEVGEAALHKAIARFDGDEAVNAAMVMRPKLPMGVAERLVVLVSDKLRQHLVTHHELSADIATDLVLDSRERATVNLTAGADQLDVSALVDQLYRNGRLTPSIVLRALCTGDMDFFETALARLGNVPVTNAYKLIHEHGDLGLKRLYDHCGLPPLLYPVIRTAVGVARQIEHDGQADDRQRYVERMVERLLTQFEGGFEGDNLDYLVGKLGRAADKPRRPQSPKRA